MRAVFFLSRLRFPSGGRGVIAVVRHGGAFADNEVDGRARVHLRFGADALLDDRAVGLVGCALRHLADDKAGLRDLLADDLNVDADEREHCHRLGLLALADDERDAVALLERFTKLGDRADDIALRDAAVFLDRVVDDKVQVKVMEIDSQGRINLSRKDALADIEAKQKA